MSGATALSVSRFLLGCSGIRVHFGIPPSVAGQSDTVELEGSIEDQAEDDQQVADRVGRQRHQQIMALEAQLYDREHTPIR